MEIDEPIKPKAALRNLEPLSVEELEGYIAEMEQEIARVRAAIATKQRIRGGADSLFKL